MLAGSVNVSHTESFSLQKGALGGSLAALHRIFVINALRISMKLVLCSHKSKDFVGLVLIKKGYRPRFRITAQWLRFPIAERVGLQKGAVVGDMLEGDSQTLDKSTPFIIYIYLSVLRTNMI